MCCSRSNRHPCLARPHSRPRDSRCSASATLFAPTIRHSEPLFPEHHGNPPEVQVPGLQPRAGLAGGLSEDGCLRPAVPAVLPVPKEGAFGPGLGSQGNSERTTTPPAFTGPLPGSRSQHTPGLRSCGPCCPASVPRPPDSRSGPATFHSELAALGEAGPAPASATFGCVLCARLVLVGLRAPMASWVFLLSAPFPTTCSLSPRPDKQRLASSRGSTAQLCGAALSTGQGRHRSGKEQTR